MTKILLSKVKNLNIIIIKQVLDNDNKRFFISTPDSIIIGVESLSVLLKSLILNGILSKKVLEGILEELEE